MTTATIDESAPDEDGGTLPEGFFDDPKLDAKARNVQYVSVTSYDDLTEKLVSLVSLAKTCKLEKKVVK